MKKILETMLVMLMIALNYGCSSEEGESAVNPATQQPNNPIAQADNYTSDKFKPYGFFIGEIASSGQSMPTFLLIDDETKSYFIFTVERIISGEFNVDSSGFFSSVDAKGFIIDSASANNLAFRAFGGNENFILKYTFNGSDSARWSVDTSGDGATLSFLSSANVASEITRTQPLPARNNIISNQYKIELSEALLLSAYNLTIDFIEDGSISGVDSNGCIYNGSYSAGNENVNTYLVNLSVASCNMRGNYSGLATVVATDGSVSTDIFVLLNSNTGAIAFTATTN